MNTRHLAPLLIAAAALYPGSAARAADAAATAPDERGFYAVAGIGAAALQYDCGYWLDCDQTSVPVARVALGHRFGGWTVEAWWWQTGRADLSDRWRQAELRLRGVGLVLGWHARMSAQSELLVRAGVLHMRHDRTDDGVTSVGEPLLGIAWLRQLSPSLALEVGWDATMADGRNVSSTLVQALTLGLRQRF